MRKPGMSPAEFQDRYLNGHAVLALKHRPGLLKYVASFVDVAPEESGADPATPPAPYDAVIETSYATMDESRRWDSDAGRDETHADGAALVAGAHLYRVREVMQRDYK